MVQIHKIALGPLGTNCYVAVCDETGEAAVVDPGWDGESLANHIKTSGWHVTHILVTHSHFDHVGGLAGLKEATGAPIYIHPEADRLLPAASRLAELWGLPIPDPPRGDVMLSDGQELVVGTVQLDVIHTPGHAPGHVCFWGRELAVLFGGDVLFQGGIGRTDLPGGDMALLMQTLHDKVLSLPDDTQVLPGHGPATTVGTERRTNPFLGDW